MFIETWVPSGSSGYIWLDTKNVLKKKNSSGFNKTTVAMESLEANASREPRKLSLDNRSERLK